MTQETSFIPAARSGAMPNEHGVYLCNPDFMARWEQPGTRNSVEVGLLELANGHWCHAVSFRIANGGGSSSFNADSTSLSREMAEGRIKKYLAERIHALPSDLKPATAKSLAAWANKIEWRIPAGVGETEAGAFSNVPAPAHLPDDETAGREADADYVGEIVTAVSAADAATRAVARQVGYRLPGGSTNPDLICRDIAANMRRTAEACIEIGKALLVLKEACGHGYFLKRLEEIGMEESLSRRFMQAALKFSNRATSHDLIGKTGSQAKLMELLVLDDESLSELSETGQTGELKLDDVACMGVRELRKAVRELRARAEAKEAVIGQKEKTISALQERLAAPAPVTVDEDENEEEPGADELADLNAAVIDIEKLSAQLSVCIRVLREVLPDTPRRRAYETSALMRAFASLRTTAIDMDIAVSNDGEASIDSEGEDEEIYRVLNAQVKEMNRGRNDEAE